MPRVPKRPASIDQNNHVHCGTDGDPKTWVFIDDMPDGVYIHIYGSRGGGKDTTWMTIDETETLITDLQEQVRRAKNRNTYKYGDPQ